ncbi:DNA polymeras-like protein alpha/primase associated subunit [Westerdykella ornata]|uniref:DNA polymerase alpha subunit B n=1 Tax=Westerdykella ornata TaxID=318751 RepID=A0A6A6JA73_WESOR|nr:DNA polymeras-like protein alpha/primase associated subunit [Westerdykella ornata]KAF2273134.1 DNA polymeras-like protein alpha/primase associated subunit [Westerdykella ornata]
MDRDTAAELTERFQRYCNTKDDGLPEQILGELQSMLRLYDVTPEELDFKWQAYSMKMGADETPLELRTARDFKKNLQDTLERESRAKAQTRNETKRHVPTPRAGKGAEDVFGMLDGLVPNTPRPGVSNGVNGSTVKRKSNFDTPVGKASKSHEMSSPGAGLTPKIESSADAFVFASREHAGDITEQLNGHILLPEPPEEAPAESRIKLKANTDMSKFSYKTMAMKLSEASEVLDDRIDEFRQLVQDRHQLENSAFGDPTFQSPSEIIAVGRIASDTSDGKLNVASLVLEGSRRWGRGRRIPLKVDNLQSYNFFPGQIVALRGTNASGDFFKVTEVISLPLLNQPASRPDELDTYNTRLLDTPESDPDSVRALTVLMAAGPYTTDQDLDFSPLHTLLDNAISAVADSLILIGPFLDAEHPVIRSGDFDVPPQVSNPDQATLNDLFRHHISSALQNFCQRLPTCNVILVPSLRDAHHAHAAFPQDKFVKKELGLPKQVQCVTNPMTLSMNEIIVGMSSLDILDMLRREELVGGKARNVNLYERGARNVIEQRSFLPIFPPTGREKLAAPATVKESLFKGEGGDGNGSEVEEEEGPSPFLPLGTMLDTSYLKLGEMLNVRPDVLVMPSVLQGCVKVVESVLVVNPGTLSKRRAAGTYARMIINPARVTDEEREMGAAVAHKLWERARVDIVKI